MISNLLGSLLGLSFSIFLIWIFFLVFPYIFNFLYKGEQKTTIPQKNTIVSEDQKKIKKIQPTPLSPAKATISTDASIVSNENSETISSFSDDNVDVLKKRNAAQAILIKNLRNEISCSRKLIKELRNQPDTHLKLTYDELLKLAGVPDGVSFDENMLPHYYENGTVEKNLHVYTCNTGSHYHRRYGCCGAETPMHLFVAANSFKPCKICITSEQGQTYKIPPWYYHFIELCAEHDCLVKTDPKIRYQLKISDESIESLNEL